MLIGIIISVCLIIAGILDYKNKWGIFRFRDFVESQSQHKKEIFTFNGERIYTKQEVKEKMKLSYNKALEEIHHPLFDRDNWIEEDLKK